MRDQTLDDLRILFQAIRPDFVMMVQAYFDESGTHDGSPVMCVAGYVFDAQQCLCLDQEWADALGAYGLNQFHAVECAHGVGAFAALNKKDRNDLTIRLIGIIKRRMRLGVAVSLSDTDFGKVPPPQYDRGGPYMFCVMQVLAGVVAWADKYSYQGEISYFFESGHKHEKLAHQSIKELQSRLLESRSMRVHSVTFGGKSDFRPLQAADILAYEWCKELKRKNIRQEKYRPMRAALESLLDQSHIAQHFDAYDVHGFFDGDSERLHQRMREFHVVE